MTQPDITPEDQELIAQVAAAVEKVTGPPLTQEQRIALQIHELDALSDMLKGEGE